ncbi:hypothetical protein SNE26_04555 [Mucilaginibacter sp. cycad4]|uniref:hypothetical protein n=1 Tax=Mucilaginibacter sp. cycad4 TaxID=3342096 RepID=UPI002AAA626F|nr:hypothetical protein [Mucilaginibacter gossypii]WPV01035.1 hypothetical protein SNE26_04555 [Mucilaginibacter gossypii]
MKKLGYLLILFALAACNHQEKQSSSTASGSGNNDNSFKPYQLNKAYTIVDTGFVDAEVMECTYAVITRDNKLADTIDKDYGIQKIGDDSYLYLTLTDTKPINNTSTKGEGRKKSISGSLGKYVVTVNGNKQLLSTLVPDFNDYFSSPSVINGNIFYWQIKQKDTTGNNRVSAAKFNPVTKKTNAYYLVDDYIETDDANYFAAPYLKNDTIYFNGENNKLRKFTKDLKPYN